MMGDFTGKTIIVKDAMDSQEERDFYEWLLEAEDHDLVRHIHYQPESFKLSARGTTPVTKVTKKTVKQVDKFLLHPHVYTPDFWFNWYGDKDTFKTTLAGSIYVDVKGTFGKHGDTKQFRINQKWVFSKFGIYINEVVPEKLFAKTWLPEACRLTPKTRKPVKKYIGFKTIGEYLT